MIRLLFLLLATTAVTAAVKPAARWDNSRLLGAGGEVFPYEVEPVFPVDRFSSPVMTIPYLADGERWFAVLGRNGEVWSCPAADRESASHLSFHVARHLAKGGDARKVRLQLLGGIFDREFPARPFLYLRYSERGSTPPLNRLVRYEVTGTAPLELGAEVEILSWESAGHDGGDLAWGPRDGYLYVSSGDGSSPGDPDDIGQQTEKIRGAILRLDVHAGEGGKPYRVPMDNPFVGKPPVRPELWCYGLRNPWRMGFHHESGELWVGDNGDESWEMVYRIQRGANYGWSAFEGSHVFRASNPLAGPNPTHALPVVEHPHREMRSVVGGDFYRGASLPELQGRYVYGCYFTKRLWALTRENGTVGTPVQIADAKGQVVSFDEDHEGEMLITCLDGGIYRLRQAARREVRPWPALLSETGVFSDTAAQRPAPGVQRYAINAESWMDGAARERFVAIPAGERLRQGGGGELDKSLILPEGSALVQTLSLGGQRVETQVLFFDGMWRGYTYQWRADQRDATLVGEDRAEVEVDVAGEGKRRWTFLSRAECMTCHTQRSNFAIAFTAPQLDRSGADGENQLEAWVAGGLLQQNGVLRQRRGRPTPDPHEASLPLETRARSYLDLNCAHCHRETGLGGRAGFQLLARLSLEETAILDAKPVVGMTGDPAARVVAPGDPARSELLARMMRRGAGQMPLIGSDRVDARGVALIREWIESLGPEAGKE